MESFFKDCKQFDLYRPWNTHLPWVVALVPLIIWCNVDNCRLNAHNEEVQQRMRVEHMERQLANLTGLVQKALQTPSAPPPRDFMPVASHFRTTQGYHLSLITYHLTLKLKNHSWYTYGWTVGCNVYKIQVVRLIPLTPVWVYFGLYLRSHRQHQTLRVHYCLGIRINRLSYMIRLLYFGNVFILVKAPGKILTSGFCKPIQ